MDKKCLMCCLQKSFTNRYLFTILVLLSLVTSASGHSKKDFIRWKIPNHHKNEPASRLFLIAVIDSDDEIIGKRCEKDLEELTDDFDDFSSELDMITVLTKIIKGNQYSKAAVNDAIDIWLKSQQPSQGDIVVFYFSGHGFRFSNDVSVYPRMWLKTASDKNVETTNLSMESDIFNRIRQMGAGVNIVLSDCCNSVPGAHTAFTVTMNERSRMAKPTQEEIENDRKDFDELFMPDNPISIIATASDSTELAGGTALNGGFFTHFFLEGLEMSIYGDDLEPSWEKILNYAKEEARKKALAGACPDNRHNKNGRCIQTATFNIRYEVNPQ